MADRNRSNVLRANLQLAKEHIERALATLDEDGPTESITKEAYTQVLCAQNLLVTAYRHARAEAAGAD